jgi:hypothetical protein
MITIGSEPDSEPEPEPEPEPESEPGRAKLQLLLATPVTQG